nr:copia protein [Tanacetum cinerariifolium]
MWKLTPPLLIPNGVNLMISSRCGFSDPYVILFKNKCMLLLKESSFNDDSGASTFDSSSSSSSILMATTTSDNKVSKPSTPPTAFVSTSSSTWHQRLEHPEDEVLRSHQFISCNKAKSTHVCHACQLDSLHKELDLTDLGALNYFLGISVVRHPTGLFLSQKKLALQLLERAHMVNCNSSQTPVDTESKLGPNGVPVQDPILYRSLVVGIQYLTFTRPDLSYVVQHVCVYMHDPRELHFAALKRILRNVQGTLELGLHLYASATTSLVGYTDADWAGCPSTRSGIPGVANVVAETARIRNLLRELHSPLLTAVYCDNVSAVYMSANPVQHQCTKHIEIDIHFVRDMVKAGHVRVLHVSSRFQYADIFTKGLPSALFEDFRSSLSVYPPPAQTAGAY